MKNAKEEMDVKNYLLLHYGFKKPTSELMVAWGKWFESIAAKLVDGGRLPVGREISRSGTKDLPMAKNSITGYSVIQAKNLREAEKVARIACTSVDYESKRCAGTESILFFALEGTHHVVEDAVDQRRGLSLGQVPHLVDVLNQVSLGHDRRGSLLRPVRGVLSDSIGERQLEEQSQGHLPRCGR